MAERYDPAEIIERVKAHENQMANMHVRQEGDFRLWRGDAYDPPDVLKGFYTRTSNEPRTLGDKVISIAAEAQLLPRIPGDKKDKKQALIDSVKERGGIGWLRAGDKRLERLLEQDVQTQSAWQGAIRGWITGRPTLAKRSDGKTYVNIRPWDPKSVSWGMGDEGPDWACYHTRRHKDKVAITVDDVGLGEQSQWLDRYDYYDTQNNLLIVGNSIVKPPTPHGAGRTPVYIVPVGPQPAIYDTDDTPTAFASYGESIYHALRRNYLDNNFVTSCIMTLVARSIKQGFKTFSKDGELLIEGNPWLEDSQTPLRTGEQDIVPVGMLEMAKETSFIIGLIAAERQRAGLPNSAYGELAFQLSGFAINSLREGILTVVRWIVKAMKTSYNQILDILSEQYVSGSFLPMTVSGYSRNGRFFSEELPMRMVEQGGEWDVALVPSLPQDDPGKLQMAQIARKGPVPLYSDDTIHEKILLTQDPDLERDKIQEQLGERAFPMVASYELMTSADARGDKMQAAMIETQLRLEVAKQQLQLFQLQQALAMAGAAPQPGANGRGGGGGLPDFMDRGGGGGDGAGLNPETLPPGAQGIAPPEPVDQMGALVGPGSSRPGARNGGRPEDSMMQGG